MDFIGLMSVVNIGSVLFILATIYQSIKYRDKMSEEAFHHLVSHGYIVLFFCISVDVFYLKEYVSPLIFTFLYITQHVFKENLRLVCTNRWTKDVEDV